jgi:hypothetical protein
VFSLVPLLTALQGGESMRHWREEVKSVQFGIVQRLGLPARVPTYQKVTLWLLALGALIGFLGFLFFR